MSHGYGHCCNVIIVVMIIAIVSVDALLQDKFSLL